MEGFFLLNETVAEFFGATVEVSEDPILVGAYVLVLSSLDVASAVFVGVVDLDGQLVDRGLDGFRLADACRHSPVIGPRVRAGMMKGASGHLQRLGNTV